MTASGEYGVEATSEFRIMRDSSLVAEFDGQWISVGAGGNVNRRHNTAYNRSDTPAAGTYDYTLQVRSKGAGGTTVEATRWKYRRGVAMVAKR